MLSKAVLVKAAFFIGATYIDGAKSCKPPQRRRFHCGKMALTVAYLVAVATPSNSRFCLFQNCAFDSSFVKEEKECYP
jgi:hypothetical protein